MSHDWLSVRRRRAYVGGRRTLRLIVVVIAAVAAGALAVGFAWLCDEAILEHAKLARASRWLAVAVTPLGLLAAALVTRRLAPQASGSGIPQVIAAAARPTVEGARDARISVRTAVVKALVCIALLACGASIGREGPTVQITAAAVVLITSVLRQKSSDRRSIIIAGGAAGVAAAFNTPIAGVVFAVEELAKGFDRRTNTIVILVVVTAGAAAYALAGNYAYFGELRSSSALTSAWLTAILTGVLGGVIGGLFSRALVAVLGPGGGPLARLRTRRPISWALGCGLVVALAAWLSGGATYGTGYLETRNLLAGASTQHAFSFSVFKVIANLGSAGSGAPGGIFSPSLAAGAGMGAWLGGLLPFATLRDSMVLGMASYLSGVVQAPLTSAVILMEMTRDPGLVGPLMLGALIARAIASRICREPVYHALAGAAVRSR